MRKQIASKIKAFFKTESVFCIAALCAVLTMFFVLPDREYAAYIDLRVLCLLACLMAVVAGFQHVGIFRWITYQLLHRIGSGRILGAALVLLPFFCSMLVTNDVALIVFIPFTLALLTQINCDHAIIPTVVLQTIAANLGSMATPVGNPQNLYLYAVYALDAGEFFSVMLPLTAISLFCLAAAAPALLPKQLPQQEYETATIEQPKTLLISAILFLLCLLTVFRLLPYPLTTVIVLVTLGLTERTLLRKIDYMLLLTFVCFFIVSGNLGRIETIRTFLQNLLSRNALMTAVGASQIISNVPAAVLLSAFTDQWQALLAGTNIGGLGTPIASLASLITLKLYLRHPNASFLRFLGVFTLANGIGLVILLGFYRLICM